MKQDAKPSMDLEIKSSSDEITHVAFRGRLDIAGVGEIELKFTSLVVPRAKPLLLDMSGVSFISSLGLRLLLTVAKELDRCGCKTVLLSPQTIVAEVLKVSGFDQLIPVFNDERTALAVLVEGERR